MKRSLVAVAFLFGAIPCSANAQELSDLLPGVTSDGLVPMERILAEARGQVDGTITEIELERKRGVWVYEVDVVAHDGRKMELLFDARTAQLLSRKRD